MKTPIRTLTFPPFRLDPANACLWRGTKRLALAPKDFAVLHYLNRTTRHWHNWLPTPFMLSVARRAKSKHVEDWIWRPSTSLRYAQDERESVPLWVRKCTNLLWSDLVSHAGQLVTHEELLKAVWPDAVVSPQGLKAFVRRLRHVLHDRADRPRFIETVHGQGAKGWVFLPTSPHSQASNGAEQRRRGVSSRPSTSPVNSRQSRSSCGR